MKKELFIFIGPPGSGKGSLSTLCTKTLKWVQLSTGNLCRKHIQEQTPIGKEIALVINSGKLIPDALISSMVEEWLIEKMEQEAAIILDGYPRAVAQAQVLDTILKERFNTVKLHVIKFTISDDQIIHRLTGRLVCQNSKCQAVYSLSDAKLAPQKPMVCDICSGPLSQREDDKMGAVKERLHIYHQNTQDLLNFYKSIKQPIIELKADKSLPIVFEDFKKLVGLGAL